MIRIDRAQLLNGHSFRLGVSGSGKSMSAKEELVEIALRTKDDILILDPESEFGQLVKALGGEVLPISPHSSMVQTQILPTRAKIRKKATGASLIKRCTMSTC